MTEGRRNNPPACGCIAGYFLKDDLTCGKCHYRCKECKDYKTCTKCNGNRVDPSTCGCPAGTYDTKEADCPKCDDKCDTCLGKADKCLKCAPGRNPPPLCPVLPPSAKSVEVIDIPVGSA